MTQSDLLTAAECVNTLSLEGDEMLRRLEQTSTLDTPLMLPSSDHDLFWIGNPLPCGTMMFNSALMLEQAGVALANYHLSILRTSYRYAALKHSDLLRGQLPELEKLINIHPSPMFFGSLPVSPTSMYNAFVMRLGVNPKEQEKNPNIAVGGQGGHRTARSR